MITIIFYGLIFLFSGYFIYLALLNAVKKKSEKLFQTKKQQIDDWEVDLKSQYFCFEQQKQLELNNIAEKQAELSRKQAENLAAISAAEKNYEAAQIKILAMQKRIDQLQSELYQARKRAERLAKKTKTSV